MLSKSHTKYIQSLHLKKNRDADGVFIAEGTKVVLELLDSKKFKCLKIYAINKWILENEKLIAKQFFENIETIEEFDLKKISNLTTPNGVLAIFSKENTHLQFDVKNKITLALDNIQDPGNFGSIIRIADWYGITQIMCNTGCADMYNSKVVQSTMGSLGRIHINYINLENWLRDQLPIPIYATAMEGKSIHNLSKIKEAIIVIGNEGKGISPEIMQIATQKITIPKIGHAESLNAAVATGIVLSHIL